MLNAVIKAVCVGVCVCGGWGGGEVSVCECARLVCGEMQVAGMRTDYGHMGGHVILLSYKVRWGYSYSILGGRVCQHGVHKLTHAVFHYAFLLPSVLNPTYLDSLELTGKILCPCHAVCTLSPAGRLMYTIFVFLSMLGMYHAGKACSKA